MNYGGLSFGNPGSGNTSPAFTGSTASVAQPTNTMSTSPEVTPAYKDWPLRWADEFTSTTLDLNKWGYGIGNACEYGFCGWGNNEEESYQTSAVSVVGGALRIEARKEWSPD
eukprot:10438-Heterococcus_DN1.PRE.1